jgi:hypothetical protein
MSLLNFFLVIALCVWCLGVGGLYGIGVGIESTASHPPAKETLGDKVGMAAVYAMWPVFVIALTAVSAWKWAFKRASAT